MSAILANVWFFVKNSGREKQTYLRLGSPRWTCESHCCHGRGLLWSVWLWLGFWICRSHSWPCFNLVNICRVIQVFFYKIRFLYLYGHRNIWAEIHCTQIVIKKIRECKKYPNKIMFNACFIYFSVALFSVSMPVFPFSVQILFSMTKFKM